MKNIIILIALILTSVAYSQNAAEMATNKMEGNWQTTLADRQIWTNQDSFQMYTNEEGTIRTCTITMWTIQVEQYEGGYIWAGITTIRGDKMWENVNGTWKEVTTAAWTDRKSPIYNKVCLAVYNILANIK